MSHQTKEYVHMHRLLLLMFLFFTTMRADQQPRISYTLSMPEPWTHLYEVEVRFEGLPTDSKSIDLMLPVWRTGRYVLFDFAGGVQEFSAKDGSGQMLPWSKTDKSTWQISTNGKPVVSASYRVYADEFDMRTRGLNDEYGFVDGIAVFMYVEQYRHLPVVLKVVPYGTWHVTTGLEHAEGAKSRFTAPSYDVLADSPLFIGQQKDFTFTVGAKEHVLSILGTGDHDPERMIKDITSIIKACKEFWGELPYERYVFMLQLWSHGGGATEHLNSTIIQMRPFGFSKPSEYDGFCSDVAHEFFHTWNVKQLRPHALNPYDFTKESYTKELWISEGTTSYYTPIILKRAGMLSGDRMLQRLAHGIRQDRERPGNKVESLSESSFDAWIKFWRERPDAYNAQTDYYGKGAMVSFLLDLEIRHHSGNKASLDDVMRAMYHRFPLSGQGFTIDDFQKVCEELAGSKLDEFFQNYVHGTVPLPWEASLLYAGLELKPKERSKDPWLGVWTRDEDGQMTVKGVVTGSPAYNGGLNVNDEILALDGYKVRSSDLTSRITAHSPGDTVMITVFRNDVLRKCRVVLDTRLVPEYTITRLEDPSALQKEIYKSMFGDTSDEE